MTSEAPEFRPVLLAWPDYSPDALDELIRLIGEAVDEATRPLLFLYRDPATDGSRDAIGVAVREAFDRVGGASLDLSVEVLPGPIGTEAWRKLSLQIAAQLVVGDVGLVRWVPDVSRPLIRDARTLEAVLLRLRYEASLAALGISSVAAPESQGRQVRPTRPGDQSSPDTLATTPRTGAVDSETEISLIAWPEYSPRTLDRLFAMYGSVLAKHDAVRVLFGLHPGSDPEEGEVAGMLSDSFDRVCGKELELDASIVPLPLSAEASAVLSRAIRAQVVADPEGRYVSGLSVPIVADVATLEAILTRPQPKPEAAGPGQPRSVGVEMDSATSPGEDSRLGGTRGSNAGSRDPFPTAGQKISRVVIMDPGLIGVAGHHFSSAKSFIEEAGRLGLEYQLISNLRASDDVQRLGALPRFSVTGYQTSHHWSRESEFEELSLSNAVFFHDLRNVRSELGIGPSDLVLFPGVTNFLFLAACQFIGTFNPSAAPRFALCLLHPPKGFSHTGQSFCESAISFLPEEAARRLVTICETKEVADEYRPLLHSPPIVAPVPVLQRRFTRDPGRRETGEGTTVSFLGGARPEKGLHLMPRVVELVLAQDPGVQFSIHLMGPRTYVDGVREALEPHRRSVKIVEGEVGEDRFVQLLQATDLMILPYDPARYRTRGSGVFSECKSAGIPMVLPRHTAMGAEAADKGLGVTFDDHSAESVARCALIALEDVASLRAACEHERQIIRETESGYLSRILERGTSPVSDSR